MNGLPAAVPSTALPGVESAVVVQVAFQQADYVAWNVWSAINGRPLLPFKYQHLGDMMSLGKAAPPSVEGCRHHAAACCMILAAAVAAGRTSGAVTLPVSVSEGVASSLQSGPLGSLLGAAGIR